MKKRTVALVFLGLVVGLVAATLAVLRTRWAGEKVCGAAAAKVEAATGLRFTFEACRLDGLGLAVEVEHATLAPPGAPPVFSAERVHGRLAAVQALGRQLHLERLTLVKPRIEWARPAATEARPARCPPAFLSRFEIRRLEVEEGAVDVAVGATRLRLEGVQIHSAPGRRSLRALAGAGRRTRLSVSTGRARLELPARTFEAARAGLLAEVAPNLSAAEIASAEVELGGARLGLAGRVTDLCDPRLDVELTADGPVESLLALGGVRREASGRASLTVKVKGRPSVAAALAGDGAPPEERTAVAGKLVTRGVEVGRFTLGDVEAEARLDGGAVRIDRLAAAVRGGAVAIRGAVRLARGLPFQGEVDLGGVNLNEVLERLGVRDSWITVRLTGKGRMSGTLAPVALEGEFDAEAHGLKALSRSYKEAADDPGIVAVERGRLEGKVRVDLQALAFEDVRVKVGRGTLRTDARIHFSRKGGFSVRASGDVDLDALGRIGTVPWGGMAAAEIQLGAAPYALPIVEVRVRGTDLRFLDVRLGTAAADLRFERPALRIAGEGSWQSVSYRGDVVLDLLARPMRLAGASLRARGRTRDLCAAVLDRLPRAIVLHDALDGEAEVAGTARGPAAQPDLEFEAQLGPGTLYARRHDGGRVTGRVRALEELRIAHAELRRAGGVARGAGTMGLLPPFPMKYELDFQGLPLADLELAPDLAGGVAGTASVAGTTARPRVQLTAAGTAVAWRTLALGAAKLEGRLDGDAARLTLGAEGVDLTGEVLLAGRRPFRARGRLAVDDALRLAGATAAGGVRLHVGGAVEADGDLLDWREAHVEAHLDRLEASYSDLRIEAAAPARLTAARGRWELLPVTLRGPNTSLTLRGARLPSGELDASADGAFDLRLLSVLVPSLRRSSGQLGLEARFSGSVEEPLVIGTGKVVDGAFQLKGASLAFTGVGGVVAFSQNKVIFDRLDATVNGGKARLDGEIELARLVPVRLRAGAVLEAIPVTVPGFVPATLSGRLEVAGAPDSAALTGRLHVIHSRYTSDVGLESSLLKRKAPPAPRPYDRAGEWLRLDVQLAVDGDVRVDNDLVHGPVSGELTLTGTLAAPGLVGSLAMGRGSRATFRGNEFELSHAVLDFSDRSRIAAALDVNGEARVREYQVFLHAFGPVAEPQVKLTSLPELPEQDIVTLLSLGFTRRDAGAQAGVSGVATATAAQALLSASGLDEQVRRFLPPGGPIRDLSMRIVTGVSPETGQVEPRAEFESWLLRDRLRLRFQTPLGAGRGRKAQAEVRLGEHMALQYQWDDEDVNVPAGDHGLDLKLRWDWTDDR